MTLAETGLYGGASVVAAVYFRDRTRWTSALDLLVVYPILHLAYGIGMVRGLWQFGIRGRRPGPPPPPRPAA